MREAQQTAGLLTSNMIDDGIGFKIMPVGIYPMEYLSKTRDISPLFDVL
jgi:hypothetical protein